MVIFKYKFIYITFLLVFFSLHCKKEQETPLVCEDPETPSPSPFLFTQAERDTILYGDSATIMRIMNYFMPSDSIILTSTSKDVLLTPNDTVLKRLTDRMLTTVRMAQGVGIAAPQVGILRNVIWVQRYDKGTFNNRPFEVYLNPKITAYSDTVARRPDGCLSVPQSSAYPEVIDSSYRAIWVEVDYYLPNGSNHKEKITHWFTAHIFQHEIDHLNGIMFFDRYVTKNSKMFTILPHNPEDYHDILLERQLLK